MIQLQHPIRLGLLAFTVFLVACATSVKPGNGTLRPSIQFQSNELNPSNGGQLITAEALRPGDILLTADNGLNSAGIRLITQSPVSHAVRAAVQLGLGRSDQFFCSQFVLEAYRLAGLALTNADPRLISPADLLHMREGDVPSVKINQVLLYVGHMKVPPEPLAANKMTP